jgi:hypothetical protein
LSPATTKAKAPSLRAALLSLADACDAAVAEGCRMLAKADPTGPEARALSRRTRRKPRR